MIVPSSARLVKVATPATAATLTVFIKEPPVPLVMVAVTVSVTEVSVTRALLGPILKITTGCVLNAVLLEVPTGLVVISKLGTSDIAILFDVAEMSPAGVNVIVKFPAVLGLVGNFRLE